MEHQTQTRRDGKAGSAADSSYNAPRSGGAKNDGGSMAGVADALRAKNDGNVPVESEGGEREAEETPPAAEQAGPGAKAPEVQAPAPEQEQEQSESEGEETTDVSGTVQAGTPVGRPNEGGGCDCSMCVGARDVTAVSKKDGAGSTSAPKRDGEGAKHDNTAKKGGEKKDDKKKKKEAPTDAKVDSINISFEFTNPGTKAVTPFGAEDFNCAHKNSAYTTKGDKLSLDFTIHLHCPWGVNGGTNTDIPGPTSPLVTTGAHVSGLKVWEQIRDDLTPDKSDNHRPPRAYYWSRALTERHERYHSLMDEEWGKGKGKDLVKKYLKGKSVTIATAANEVKQLLDDAMVKMSDANFDWYSGGGKDYINRPGEKAAFKEGKDAYKELAKGVEKQGKKLEKEEAAAKKLEEKLKKQKEKEEKQKEKEAKKPK